MLKKSSLEDVLSDFKKAHGDKYDYSKVVYLGANVKVEIICPEHGSFWQVPKDHKRGLGCSLCKKDRRKHSEDDFKIISSKVHSNKYDYSFVHFDKISDKVKIICPVHGEFVQSAHNHMKGQGCPECSKRIGQIDENLKIRLCVNSNGFSFPYFPKYMDLDTEISCLCPDHGEFITTPRKFFNTKTKGCKSCLDNIHSYTFEEFKSIASNVHNNKYKYIESSFVKMKVPIDAICPIHGNIKIIPATHIAGAGCRKCGFVKSGLNQRMSSKDFVSKVSGMFPDLDFSETVYTTTENKVSFRCKEHGLVEATAKNLIQGLGCPKCKMNSFEREINVLLSSFDIPFEYGQRYSEINGMELDFYFPSIKFGIELNGLAFHHSTPDNQYLSEFYKATSIDWNYHYGKWKACKDVGITLFSIPDFYWYDESKRDVILSKIKHHLGLDKRIYARKCKITEIDNPYAYDFYDQNHIDGKGFPYRNSKSFGLIHNDEVVMSITIGEIYDQTQKRFKLKVSRVATLKGVTVVGGLSRLLKHLKFLFGDFSYQINLMFGGSSIKISDNCKSIGPRYFWVNPKTGKYYHRNYCQKQVLEKNFGEPLLDGDTETTYMTRLGYLKYFDNGIVEFNGVTE